MGSNGITAEFSRQNSLTSSLRRLRDRTVTRAMMTTTTRSTFVDNELLQNDYVQKEFEPTIDIQQRHERDDAKASGRRCRKEASESISPSSLGSNQNIQKRLLLQRHFGTVHCLAVLLGGLVSFGTLFSVREIYLNCGGLVPALLVWLSAGAMMFVGAQCYAELATFLPKSGGDFIFLFRALPTPMPAFMQVWMGLVMGSGAVVSALGRMGAIHLLRMVCPWCPTGADDADMTLVNLSAALIICVFIMIHCRSTSLAAQLQLILTIGKLTSFVIIIILALAHIATGRTSNLSQNAWYPPPPTQASPMVAFAVASMSLSGWQSIAFVTEEVKTPEKTIPRVTSFAVLIAIGLCVILNTSYATILTPDELLSTQPVIMLIGHKVLGSWGHLSNLPIMICALSDMNVIILIISRMFFSAGREGQAPSLWSMVSVRNATPTPAVLIMLPIALLLLLVDIGPILATLGPFQWLTSAMVVLTLPIYRIRYPDQDRPFKVPLMFPVLYITYCLFLTALAVYNRPVVLGLIAVMIVPAFPLQIILVRLQRPRRFLRLVERVTRFLQKLLLVAPPDRTDEETHL